MDIRICSEYQKRENKIKRQERKNIIFHYQAICRKRHAGKNSDTESEKRQVSGARISGLAILWKRRHYQEQVESWDRPVMLQIA